MVTALLAGTGTMAYGQQGPFVPIPAEQIQLQVPPPATPTLRANYIGVSGVNTFWYWVIANYNGGVSPAGNPAVVSGAANLSATNTVVLSWSRPQGAQSFTVVRTTGPNLVSCTSCLLANMTTATNLTDTGGSIGNFNPQNPLVGASAVITINNRDRANPFVTVSGSPGSTVRQVPLVQGTFVAGQAAVWDANGNLVSQVFPSGGLGDPGSNGVVVRTALDTTVARTITAGTNVSVSNGDGVAGNPVINATGGTVNSGADQDLACYQGAGTTVGPCSTAQILFGGVGNIVGATTGAAAMKFGAAGTVLLPPWTFGGDLDTGIFRIGANNFGVALGGVQMASWGGGQTMRVWDQTPTTGSTRIIIKDGAGQSGTLVDFSSASDDVKLGISNGLLIFYDAGSGKTASNGSITNTNDGLQITAGHSNEIYWSFDGQPSAKNHSFSSDFSLRWGNSTTAVSGSDTGFARQAAGVIRVTNGSTGFGRIALDNSTPSAANDACTAQSIWADADFVYVCVASGDIRRVGIATW